jgi:hypothetical protein
MSEINRAELKKNIETVAAEEGKTTLEIISLMQSGCVITGNDEMLDALCELKWDYIPQ